MRVFFRVAAWLLLVAIVFLSLSPPVYRPVTRVGHSAEHFLIYLAVGLALGLGYSARWRIVAPSVVMFAAIVELGQLLVPGRHARLHDFVIDAVAACVGIALSSIGTAGKRVWSGNQPPRQPCSLPRKVRRPRSGGAARYPRA